MKKVEALIEEQRKLLEESNKKRMIWADAMRHEGWRLLCSFLENEYIMYSLQDADSLVKLGRRNEAISLIKRIFHFVQHDLNEAELYRADFRAIQNMESELPTPYDPYGLRDDVGNKTAL